jgi:hypothetical protein
MWASSCPSGVFESACSTFFLHFFEDSHPIYPNRVSINKTRQHTRVSVIASVSFGLHGYVTTSGVYASEPHGRTIASERLRQGVERCVLRVTRMHRLGDQGEQVLPPF